MAFGDYRDQLLLEFERRIYDNIKMDGNPVPLTAEDVIPGFFRTTDYSQTETTNILGESFLTWVGWNKLNYKAQDYQPGKPFSYNYSTAGNKINNEPLLGAWRGIYRYFYDTITPNYTPWEMLGLSEKPIWWEDRYGPAPYTSDNLVLWDDLEAGLAGHAQVGEDDVEGLRIEEIEGLIGAGRDGHIITVREGLLESFAGVFLVIDDENGRHHGFIHAAATTAVKPREGAGATNAGNLLGRDDHALDQRDKAAEADRRMSRGIEECDELVAPKREEGAGLGLLRGVELAAALDDRLRVEPERIKGADGGPVALRRSRSGIDECHQLSRRCV
jgi:hypothetical protein